VNTASDILLDINNLLFGMAKKFRDENTINTSHQKVSFLIILSLNMLGLHMPPMWWHEDRMI
jgi:hypothetical protein